MKNSGGMAMERFKIFLDTTKFHKAKTWENFAPHEYIIRNKLSKKDQKIFDKIKKFIERNGYRKKFLYKYYNYYNYNGYRYWIDIANGSILILNRTEDKREFL